MTYSVGGLIQATDFNGFVGPTASGGTAGANLNDIWGTGSSDKGWGQTAITNVIGGSSLVAAPGQWTSLVNNLATAGTQTNTAMTSRTAPVTGDLITILSNMNTDLTNVTTNRGNAAVSGTTSTVFTGTISKTSPTASGTAAWTITFTQTVTFPSADQARYFFNAGGLVRLDMNKSSTGTDSDADWNSLVGRVGTIYFSGRVNSNSQTIAGTTYTGTTRVGGSGTPTIATTTGWYSLTPGAAATQIYILYDSVNPYTGDYIRTTAAVNAGSTILTLVTTWVSTSRAGAGQTTNISGGTGTTSPFSSFGTAPTVLCRYIPPSTTYLSNSWGTPTINSTVT